MLSDRVIFVGIVTDVSASLVVDEDPADDDEMRFALSRNSDKSSTEFRWADNLWYIDGSFLMGLK